MEIISGLLVLLGLTLLNGFFAGSEIAMLSVRKTRLDELAREGNRAARAALGLRENPERLLATVQVGITVIGATAGAFGGVTLERPLADWLVSLGVGTGAQGIALALVVVWVSFFSIVLGELVPKSLALRAAERFTLLVARAIVVISAVARPVVWFLTAVSNLLLRPFRDQTTFTETRLSPEELQQLVEEASAHGTVHPTAGDIASRAVDLGALRVSAIMVPRAQVVSMHPQSTKEEVWRLFKKHPHSRYPVVEDGPDDVQGYVLARDLVSQLIEKDEVDIRATLRPVPFILEGKRAIEALREMQEQRTLLAVVVDEQGGMAGIVTLEDITEELVGEIFSEHEPRLRRIRREGPGVLLVQGTMPVHELNRELEHELPEGPGFTTLGGLVVQHAGRMVTQGERLILPNGIEAEIVEASPRQVRSVRLRLPQPTPQETI